jgi:excisionase family DNA binding protein
MNVGTSAGPRPAPPNFERLINDREAATLLGGIHYKTIQRMARDGQIPAYRIGKFWCFRASELDAWIRLQSTGQLARVN